MTYTIPKPKPPITLWALGAIVIVGVIALFLAALNAFSQVMPGTQALFCAILIEASAVVEALALVRGRNWIAAAGMAVSLLVSGTYNYVQVSAAGAAIGWFEMMALALGPLTALTFLSMSAGNELATHEKKVAEWATKRQGWVDRQARKDAEKEERKLAKDNETFSGETFVKDWRNLPDEDRALIAGMTVDEIMSKYGHSGDSGRRTAQNWYNRARANGYHVEAAQ